MHSLSRQYFEVRGPLSLFLYEGINRNKSNEEVDEEEPAKVTMNLVKKTTAVNGPRLCEDMGKTWAIQNKRHQKKCARW